MIIPLLTLFCFVLESFGGSDLVNVWNDLTLKAVRQGNVPPPPAVRQMAIVHLAIFDAANSVEGKYQPYLTEVPDGRNCSMNAAVSAAAYECLRVLFPKCSEVYDSHYRAILAAIENGAAKTNGMDLGKRVADALLRRRQFDGAGQSSRFAFDDRPGYWARTPPNYDQPLLPNWGQMKTFGIPSIQDFYPPPPPPLSSSDWADQYNLLKKIGATNSTTRTGLQREIALFWADGPTTETPPGHWNRIAQQVSTKKNYGVVETARLFAILNVALSDAGVVCWKAKYDYNWWRPVTAIRAGDRDNNPATEPDLAWTPLIPTPPFPEHTSGHSSFSGAGAAVLAEISGSDDFQFITLSDGLPGIVRRFKRFSEVAQEAGMSRIYGGIHFPAANEAGLECGRKIGIYVARHLLQPRRDDNSP